MHARKRFDKNHSVIYYQYRFRTFNSSDKS